MCQVVYTPSRPSSHRFPSLSVLCPLLVFLGSLLSAKARNTFIECLWYTKQLLVLSLFSSHPLISTDPWFLLSSASFCSLPGEELGIYRAPIVCLVISFHSPSPSILPVPSSLTSYFLLSLLSWGKKTSNYGAPIVCQAIYTPPHLLLPLSPCPAHSASFSLPVFSGPSSGKGTRIN